jgi:hypothetical protein
VVRSGDVLPIRPRQCFHRDVKSICARQFVLLLWTSVVAGECPTDIPKRLVTPQTLLLPQLQRDNDNVEAPVEEYDLSNCNHESFAFR